MEIDQLGQVEGNRLFFELIYTKLRQTMIKNLKLQNKFQSRQNNFHYKQEHFDFKKSFFVW